jgi:hypothetical protein
MALIDRLFFGLPAKRVVFVAAAYMKNDWPCNLQSITLSCDRFGKLKYTGNRYVVHIAKVIQSRYLEDSKLLT